MRIDLNSDVGESFGIYKLGLDEEVMKEITSANIACGFHAGDYMVMEKTVDLAIANGVGIGVHPGYPDLQGFGRRKMDLGPHEIKNLVMYQVGALKAFAEAKGAQINHVKAHGALYNTAGKDQELAEAIAKGVSAVAPGVIFLGLANSELVKAGKKYGLTVCEEVFADRNYNPDGSLMSRKNPEAILHDPEVAILRVVRMIKEGKIEASNGEDIDIQADSICVHGDNPEAIEFVRQIRKALKYENIQIHTMGS
ncbi:LamB/YcsF family protein [Natranaerobius trueperi]|uniref:5-oxoprolinase subunit A n=1 Tax=Natranaerobius trueperi TaxID=759412 RepID=A0A226BXH5_9FIRM|nr:5-oxoprolinase subunit PxpA [Natranaerobius trueperi]OWZ82850.1 lactam utilization protein LamB [Natranaerobius trueperi]